MVWSSVVLDSRRAQVGSLFVALKGERVDGHAFLEDAKNRGATHALIHASYKGKDFGLTLMRASDVESQLKLMAKERIEKLNPTILAVTGSVGKTTTKEFLYSLLSSDFAVFKSEGNQNSQLGLPLSILNIKGNPTHLVLEMGMSMASEIARLTQIAPPTIALITEIGRAHIAHFDSQESLAKAKLEIVEHPKTKTLIWAGKAPNFRYLLKRNDLQIIGPEDFKIEKEGERFVIKEGGRAVCLLTLPFTASHLVSNFLLAAIAAYKCGLSWEKIAENAKMLKTVDGRFNFEEKGGIFFINDGYNAAPEAVLALLENFEKKGSGSTHFVFGSMKDLGAFSEDAHQEVALSALKCVDKLWCLGDECSLVVDLFLQKGKEAKLFTSFESLLDVLKRKIMPGDLVLIKGANSHGLSRIISSF